MANVMASNADRTQAQQRYNTQTLWPIRRTNTVLNVCPQGEVMIIERMGKLRKVQEPGFFFTVPVVDKIAFRVDMRERVLQYPPSLSITKDNVSVEVSAVVFMQFVDAEKACYEVANPLVAVMELAKSAMRAVVGELELDQLFHSRHLINDQVRSVVAEPASKWGVVFTRHEVLDVRTDTRISEAMDRQAAAERIRRERVLQAEGEKEQLRLQSEGARIKLENESQGNRIRVENEARAHAERIRLTAEADAERTRLAAQADANALNVLGDALAREFGQQAAQIAVARELISMTGTMGNRSNTIMIGEKTADVNTLMTQAGLAMTVGQQSASHANKH